MLLNLPGELRNRIYEYVAYESREVVLFEPDIVKALPLPLGQVCRQIYQEFNTLHEAVPLSFATKVTVRNEDFNIWSMIHSLQRVPLAAPNVDRKTVFQIGLTNALQLVNVKAFVTELSRLNITPIEMSELQYQLNFSRETFDLHTWRVNFARLAKQYRFHHSDAEQRVFESIYWSFAQQAERVDGICTKQYALGYWKTGGRLCFV